MRRRHAFTSAPESMFVCPDCGHSQRNDESYELNNGSEITCTECDAVSTVVEVEHEERNFTYEVTGRPTVPGSPSHDHRYPRRAAPVGD